MGLRSTLGVWSDRLLPPARKAVLAHIGLLVLRLGVGGFMASAHGWGKLTGFTEKSGKFLDLLGLGPEVSLALATFAEFGCALLLVLGLLTRFAALNLAVTMGVAAFVAHAADPFQRKELALLYLVASVTLMLTGGGRFSLDRWLFAAPAPGAPPADSAPPSGKPVRRV